MRARSSGFFQSGHSGEAIEKDLLGLSGPSSIGRLYSEITVIAGDRACVPICVASCHRRHAAEGKGDQ